MFEQDFWPDSFTVIQFIHSRCHVDSWKYEFPTFTQKRFYLIRKYQSDKSFSLDYANFPLHTF